MDNSRDELVKENSDMSRRLATPILSDPSVTYTSTQCTSEQQGEFPVSQTLVPKEGLLQVSTDHSNSPASRKDDVLVEGSCEKASPSIKLHKTSMNISSETRNSTSGVSGGWHFHGVPIASVSASLPLACNYHSTGKEIKQKFNLTGINLFTQGIISAESGNTELIQSGNNSSNMPEDKLQDSNLNSETKMISEIMEEIVGKVVDIVDGSQANILVSINKPSHKNLTIKEEVIQSDSPPSSNTRIGTEAKKFIAENPKITRTLETQLKKSNIPVYRKLEALDKNKTPQKKSSTQVCLPRIKENFQI